MLSLVVLICTSTTTAAAESSFTLIGALKIEVTEADAGLIKIRNKIPALNVISTPAMTKQLGKTYSINLFLPDGFEATLGRYPISSSYRGKPETLGASLTAAGKTYSRDSEGQAEFSDAGDLIRVVFSFSVANAKAGDADRQSVTVEGLAVFERAALSTLH